MFNTFYFRVIAILKVFPSEGHEKARLIYQVKIEDARRRKTFFFVLFFQNCRNAKSNCNLKAWSCFLFGFVTLFSLNKFSLSLD